MRRSETGRLIAESWGHGTLTSPYDLHNPALFIMDRWIRGTQFMQEGCNAFSVL
jgi:hypothetical protein